MRAFGVARRLYHFDDRLTAQLREAYAGNKVGLSRALDRLSRDTGWPRHAFKTHAIRLGITQGGHRRRWTVQEDEHLAEFMASQSLRTMARALGRSVESVDARAERLKLSRRLREGWYNLADLATVFGAHHSTVRGWMRRGFLGKVHEGAQLRVVETNVVRFLRRLPHEYDLRRVDQLWFKGVLFGR
jgi:hypothetical protein